MNFWMPLRRLVAPKDVRLDTVAAINPCTMLHVHLDRKSQHRLMSCMRMKTCMKMVAE
jgi:hypothetical protein